MPAYPALLDPSVDSYKVMRETVNSLITALGNTAVVAHNQGAETITTGVLDIARIPTGTLSTEVAVGDHTHAISGLSDITVTSSAANELIFSTGANTWVNFTLAEAGIEPAFSKNTGFNLNLGTGSGDVAEGDHTHTAAAISSLSDVTVTSSAANELIFSTGANTWVNFTLAEAGIAAVGHSHVEADISDLATYELNLGNPGTNGYILSSLTDGTRSWVAAGGGEVNQNAYSNIACPSGGTAAADSKTDTLTFTNGSNMSISRSGDVITFTSTDTNTQRAITNSVSTTSSTTSASATAVKTAYDTGNHSHPYAATSHTHTGSTISALDAGDTTTGVFAVARIPTGTTSSTVSLGNHTHTGSTISALDAGDTTTGVFAVARIPTGTTSSTVSLGNHTHAIYALLSGATFSGGISAPTVNATSDIRLKNDRGLYNGYSNTDNIKAHLYDFKDDTLMDQIGYMAHEVELELPTAVSIGADGFKSVNYFMVHTAKIAKLEDRILELENRLDNL